MPNKETVLTVENLGVVFDTHEILKDISFFVQQGDVLAIVGPNGSGKSVMLRSLLELVPHSGTVTLKPGLKVSYIPQHMAIDRDMPLSVREFLHFKVSDQGKLLSSLRDVGLVDGGHTRFHLEKHILDQRLGLLSGGQLQRVLIAWAIVDEPDILLFDEPTSGIDIGGEETIYNLLKKLRDQRDLTILLISHDLNIVYKYANSVICINKEMICHGVPSEVLDPAALAKLYGGETSFYQHEHGRQHPHG